VRRASVKEICWMVVLTILCIICFPINPLVLTGVLEPRYYLASFVLGWVVWAIGMVLVMAPIILFPRRGGVPRGKSFVHTTRLVDTGIYAVVRHPQYLGGILSIFVATLLFYPHWLFVILGIPGAVILYLSTKEEEKRLIEQFGSDYGAYMQRVPRMNLILGIIRLGRRQKHR
jgi:protein-S-isoprenylcysteine O-methyltransferase Ste14